MTKKRSHAKRIAVIFKVKILSYIYSQHTKRKLSLTKAFVKHLNLIYFFLETISDFPD